MNPEFLASTMLNPAVLFFFLGILAVLVSSDLEIPQPISKLMSLYLLLAIGFKGGVELIESLRPKLKRYGGMCLVSYAEWVRH